MTLIRPSLTDEQRLALQAAGDRGPVTIVDPATSRTYVLLGTEVFERYKALFGEDEFHVAELYAAMDAVAASEGWLDPEMDVYDRLDPRRSP